jgi:hypothetical protein
MKIERTLCIFAIPSDYKVLTHTSNMQIINTLGFNIVKSEFMTLNQNVKLSSLENMGITNYDVYSDCNRFCMIILEANNAIERCSVLLSRQNTVEDLRSVLEKEENSRCVEDLRLFDEILPTFHSVSCSEKAMSLISNLFAEIRGHWVFRNHKMLCSIT